MGNVIRHQDVLMSEQCQASTVLHTGHGVQLIRANNTDEYKERPAGVSACTARARFKGKPARTESWAEHTRRGVTLPGPTAKVIRVVRAESIRCGRASEHANWLAKTIHSKAEKRRRNDVLRISSHTRRTGQVRGLGLYTSRVLFLAADTICAAMNTLSIQP